MWGHKSEEMLRRAAASQGSPNTLHNRDETPAAAQSTAETTGEPSRSGSECNSIASTSDFTWGERDMGGPVSCRDAMNEFAELEREISRMSSARPPSRKSSTYQHPHKSQLEKTVAFDDDATGSKDLEAGPERKDDQVEDRDHDEEIITSSPGDFDKDDFVLDQFMREGHLERRTTAGEPAKKVGVLFKHLTVKGVGSSASFVKTLPDAIIGTFGPDLYRILSSWIPALRFRRQSELRTLIHDFTGVVRHGEMMLVLGRPGSGCSTLLKVLANHRKPYAEVTGDVSYGGIRAEEVAKHYRGEVVYNEEDDQHLPNLTVWQTLRFSLLTKTRKQAQGHVNLIAGALTKMFGISHTRNTPVGNEYVRGVSGGERKRVSIAETLATKSSVACWDNSTRGLDASTALDYAKSLRIMSDVSDRTTITTLYQAGEEIYHLMDTVMVIDEGRMLYQGPAGEARRYFEALGYYAPPRQSTPDFLTSICDVNARQFREGWAHRAPKGAAELEAVFQSSSAYKTVLSSVTAFEAYLTDTPGISVRHTFQQSVRDQKSRTVPHHSNYTVSYLRQVLICTRREFWLLWGDTTSLSTKFFIILSNGLIVGSLFYDAPLDTSGAFLRGGVCFFSIVFLGWLQLSELMKAVSGRNVIARHKLFAFYPPSTVNLARVLTDVPMLAAQVLLFGVIMYFMTNLDLDPGKFFIYLLFQYMTTFCVTALYRMLAAMSPTIDDAVRFSGIALNLLVIFTGYVMAKPALLGQKIWFGWIYYVNPIAYAYEAVLTNEFHGRTMECAQSQLVPQGEGVQLVNQGCAIGGAMSGVGSVMGDVYVGAQYDYSRGNLWRNFGIVLAFTVGYIAVTVVATEVLNFSGARGGALVLKPSQRTRKQMEKGVVDEEKAGQAGNGVILENTMARHQTQDEALSELHRSESIFTWENLSYTVPTAQGPKQLLNNVRGYAKPGVMVALMGASGAGKTTLLNTLSQRQKVGVVAGDMLVDGKPPGVDFQRGTGFVEQMDLHDETATVREALEFSAVLRQDREIPREEKIQYVEKIINLLELYEIQDAIIMSLGVEQKKRLTIGVELAAKPSLLLFLDEPTSGLDSQSAFSIVRFLRKLCAAGQAIVCTIHQPSADLIQQFDKVLALNPGGNVFYFGPVGEDGRDVIDYFASRGVECPPGKNPAEFILETAAKSAKGKKRIDWNQEWRDSRNYKDLVAEMDQMKAVRLAAVAPLSTTSPSAHHEFAAPILTQITHLTKRMFLHQHRSPSYVYGMLFTAVIIGIFNGFTFYSLSPSLSDLQNKVFTVFLIIMIPPTVLNAVLPKFYQHRALWEAREMPSRIYGWVAFCTAAVLAEIPHSVVSAVVYWCLWYWPTGLPSDAGTAGYVFLMTVLFFLFQSSWGQWVCAFAPSFTVISNVLPFFLVIFSLFNGVVVPYEQLNGFWKSWLYWANPSTYWIGGVLAATLRGLQVRCTGAELVGFNPPEGMSCAEFAAEFVKQAGRGYLVNPDDMGECGYCPYATGEEYLATLSGSPEDKWRDLGIFAAFVVSNWVLLYFFIYTVRVRGWSFGTGSVVGAMGMAIGVVKKVLEGKSKGPG